MARHVRIATVQCDCEHLAGRPGVREAILAELEVAREALMLERADLAVFSETVAALAQDASQAESIDQPGPLLACYQQMAREVGCTVAGSLRTVDDAGQHNSIVYVDPEGQVLGVYHKTFLTMPEHEEGLRPGRGPVVVDTPAGRLGGVICFDLNFEKLCHAYAALKPDILTFASMYHGGLMQSYWAYRCRAAFAAALPFHGGGVLNCVGEPLALTHCYCGIARATVNLDRVVIHLDGNRERFADLHRRYGDRVRLHIPPNLGSAVLTSECDNLTAMEVVEAMGLEPLDDYFSRAAALATMA